VKGLPGRSVDIIRDGVPEPDLQRRGDAAVWHALFSTAASAMQRGWRRLDWITYVTHPASMLGVQTARAYDTWPPKMRTRTATIRQLHRAWAAAEEWVTTAPAATTVDEALARVAEVEAAARDAYLTTNDRAILAFAIDTARYYGTDRPALPRRAIAAMTDLGEKAVRLGLDRLIDQGWLQVIDAGRPSPRRESRRAGLYRLTLPPPPVQTREGPIYLPRARSVGPGPYMGPSNPPAKVLPFQPREDRR
jgi:hypothetical protein